MKLAIIALVLAVSLAQTEAYWGIVLFFILFTFYLSEII